MREPLRSQRLSAPCETSHLVQPFTAACGSWMRALRLLTARTRVVAAAFVAVLAAVSASAQTPSPQDLKRLSLEELLRVEISTVSRVPEPSTSVPAAVFVLTPDDIRRSGATSLPEILRLVPGMQVAQQDAARYAIGIRGFADRLSRSMLVLIDGRAVYSPLFAGTYWEVQDTMLQDIERIEVIRGPGGTLWGANAVNGIVNIITKRAADTQGTLVTATAGSSLRGPVGIRYGGRAGAQGSFRAYAKAVDREPQFHADGAAYDTNDMVQGGFRADWTLGPSRSVTLQSDIYRAGLGQVVSETLTAPPFTQVSTRDADLSGGNLLARYGAHAFGGDYQVQTYYDRTRRDERPVGETRDTLDVDFQQRRRAGTRHDIVWGAGYRVTRGRIRAVSPTAFVPDERTDNLYTAFAQDDYAVAPNRLRLIVGTKFEHNDYSGFEVQPSARTIWTIDSANTVFAAVTRAVRTPSRVETDYTTTSLAVASVPAFVRLLPNPAFVPEELTAYELGYRVRPVSRLYLTASSFINDLQHAESTELLPAVVESTPPPARVILPVMFANGLHGHSYGLELTSDIRPVSWWRATVNYAFLRIQMTRNPGSVDVSQERRDEGLSPHHQLQIGSSLDLPGRTSFDWFFHFNSQLPAGPVPAYGMSTLRFAWQPRPQLDVALIGENLQSGHHLEWPAGAGGNVQIERRAHLTVTWFVR